MGTRPTCDVTVTLTTVLGSASTTVTVPEINGTASVEVTLLGQEINIRNICCPTIEPIVIELAGIATLIISATHNP
jgi:hypothetical protein